MNKFLFLFFISVVVFFLLPINILLAGTLVPAPFGLTDCSNRGSVDCPSQLPACVQGERDDKNYYYYCTVYNISQTEPVQVFNSPTGSDSFADLICKTTSFISDTILPPIAVLMMLVAGYLFLTSGGAPQRAGLAQKALLFTAAGVAVLLLAPGIVTLIGDLFNNTSLKTAPACASAVTTSVIVTSFIKLINWFSWLVAVTSVAMGLYSGFLYITARDNPQQTQKAAKVLSFVIIGVAVSILAFSIIAITKQLMKL